MHSDPSNPDHLAGCKGLGLIGCLVTSPLWCIIEDKEQSIVEMNAMYDMLLSFFNTAPEHLQAFMTGNYIPFGDKTRVHKGPVYESLITESVLDSSVEAILGIIFPAFAQLSTRMFKDHLSGGKHANLDAIDDTFASVPKSNKYAECVFGLLDHLITQKPSITTLASEALIHHVSQKKTSVWLKTQNPGDLEKLMNDARKSTSRTRHLFNERRSQIEERKRQHVAAKIKEREAAEKKKTENKELISSKMIEYGLWQSEHEVDEQVASYQLIKDKLEGLKAQLRFRQKVLQQTSDHPGVYNITKVVNRKRIPL